MELEQASQLLQSIGWALLGAFVMLFIVTVAALIVYAGRPDTVIHYDWELRQAAAEVREKIEEIEKGKCNPTNGTYIVKATDLRWMRIRLFPRPTK